MLWHWRPWYCFVLLTNFLRSSRSKFCHLPLQYSVISLYNILSSFCSIFSHPPAQCYIVSYLVFCPFSCPILCRPPVHYAADLLFYVFRFFCPFYLFFHLFTCLLFFRYSFQHFAKLKPNILSFFCLIFCGREKELESSGLYQHDTMFYLKSAKLSLSESMWLQSCGSW